ncbi:glycosyltransferase [Rheinheimera gaetbuli]
MFKDTSQIHVSDGFSAIVAFSLMQRLEKQLPITVGFYHSKEFLWGANRNLPYFEKVNRAFVFNFLAQINLIIFNESLVALYQQHGRDLSKANCFPIGVVDVSSSDSRLAFSVKSVSPLQIVSVGRLVDFKQYNKWMIELVAELKSSAMSLEYHIYGNGPLEASLRDLAKRLGVVDAVHFHGLLNYADFDATVAQYDIFVGSGTAIVQAAALGVPSIIGIENVAEPYSYGYIADITGFSYNEDGLYEKIPVAGLLHRYFTMSDSDKTMLKHKHIEKAKTFSMATCIANFARVEANAKPANIKRLPKFRYCASLLLNVVLAKLIKTHSLRFKYVD